MNRNNLPPTVPTQFQESYYECVQSETGALFSSVGIAQGWATTLVPIIMIALIPLLYLVLSIYGMVPPPEEYDSDEVNKITTLIAI